MTKTFREKIAGLICREIIEQRDELMRLANMDALTELPNRRAFDLAHPAASSDEDLHFIIFDANNFKLANDRISHDEGDKILKKYAAVLARAARNFSCRAFRLGGDEFVVICPRNSAEKIRDEIERRAKPINFGDFAVSLSGAIGATLHDADAKLQDRKQARKRFDYPETFQQVFMLG